MRKLVPSHIDSMHFLILDYHKLLKKFYDTNPE